MNGWASGWWQEYILFHCWNQLFSYIHHKTNWIFAYLPENGEVKQSKTCSDRTRTNWWINWGKEKLVYNLLVISCSIYYSTVLNQKIEGYAVMTTTYSGNIMGHVSLEINTRRKTKTVVEQFSFDIVPLLASTWNPQVLSFHDQHEQQWLYSLCPSS